MGGTEYTEAQWRADDGSSPSDDAFTVLSTKLRLQDRAASTEHKERGQSKMHWMGVWNQNEDYQKNDVVTDDSWTMIANKATNDRPAPQPTGEPWWVTGFGETPNWIITSKVTPQLMRGQRYTIYKNGFLTNARVWTQSITQTYQYLSVRNPLDLFPKMDLSPDIPPNAGAWIYINPGLIILREGATLDFLKLIENKSTNSNFTWSWNYTTPNNTGIPSSGNIIHATKLMDSFRINNVDSGGTNRSADLATVHTGDTLEGAGQLWEVTSVVNNGTWFDFNVYPAMQGGITGVTPFIFTVYADQPVDYVYVQNHFSGNANVSGLWSETGYANVALSENAYGIDIQIQDAYISPDWDFIAYSGN